MQGGGHLVGRVFDRVDRRLAEPADLADLQRLTAELDRLALLGAPKRVVLAAGEQADHRPHVVIMRQQVLARVPTQIEDRQIVVVVQPVDAAEARLAKGGDDRRRVGDGALDDLLGGAGRLALAQGRFAVGDKLVEIEHRPGPPLAFFGSAHGGGKRARPSIAKGRRGGRGRLCDLLKVTGFEFLLLKLYF